MTVPGAKVSLASQMAEVEHWLTVQRTRGFGDRPGVRDLHAEHSRAVLATLAWLQNNEREIRAFLALAPEARAAVVSHGPIVAELAQELAKREAIAKAGGPRR